MNRLEYKNSIVICNNKREWSLFVDMTTFLLSKENKRYKISGMKLINLTDNVYYHYIINHWQSINDIKSLSISNVILIAEYKEPILYKYFLENNLIIKYFFKNLDHIYS